MDKVPDQLRDKLGIAIGQQTYKAYRDVLASDRWQRLANFGARPQRLLFASMQTNPQRRLTFSTSPLLPRQTQSTPYLRKLFWPSPIMASWPELFRAMEAILRDGSLDGFRKAGIDLEKLAADLQSQAKSFDESCRTCSVQSSPKARNCTHSS